MRAKGMLPRVEVDCRAPVLRRARASGWRLFFKIPIFMAVLSEVILSRHLNANAIRCDVLFWLKVWANGNKNHLRDYLLTMNHINEKRVYKASLY